MKRRIFYSLVIIFIFLILPLELRASNNLKEVYVGVAGDVDDKGIPVLDFNIATVTIIEEESEYGNSNELIAISNNDYKFSFYMENGYVISTNPQYKFRTTKDHNFLAFFRPINKAQVLVVDANNKYLGILLVDFDSVLNPSDLDNFKDRLINRPGYEFEKWNVSFPYIITEEINIIKASYSVVSEKEFNLKVLGFNNEIILDQSIIYGKTITINAPNIEGLMFSHWQIDEEILSYNQTHTLSVYNDLMIKAIYTENVLIKPNSYLHQNVILDKTKMIFFAQNYIPEGYSVIEQGLIYLNTSEKIENDILMDNDGVELIRALRVSPHNEYTVLKDTLEFDNLYLRAYLVVEDDAGNIDKIYSRQMVKRFSYIINYELDGGENHPDNADSCSVYGSINLLPPTKEEFIFKGWFTNDNFNGEVITKIEALTKDITLYAKWERIPDEEYNITYELNGGAFNYTKEDLKVDFLKDYYEFLKPTVDLNTFMHGAGKTNGFAGTWAIKNADNSVTIERLYVADVKDSDASKNYFINQPKYNAKWLPFFDLIDDLVKETNPEQSFWGSTWTGNIRLREFFTGERYADDNRMPSNIQSIVAPSKYSSKESITLVAPIRSGYDFAGWYDNPTFQGSPITVIAKGSSGNKIFYARWLRVNREVTISPSSVSLTVGGTANLTATVKNLDNPNVTWKTSDSKIVSISATGVLKGIGSGSAIITATSVEDPTIQATINVTVKNQSGVLTIIADPGSTINVGASGYQLYIRDEQNKEISRLECTFTTSAPTVATVSSYGTISALKAGSAVITVVHPTKGMGKITLTIKGLITSTTPRYFLTEADFRGSPAYKKYPTYASSVVYNQSFPIPGMEQTNHSGNIVKTMVPQGLTFAKDYFLISAYDSAGAVNSVLYVINAEGNFVTTIILPSKAHVGGLAFDGYNVWVTGTGLNIHSFKYSVITSAVNSGKEYYTLASYQKTFTVKTTPSFMGYHNGMVWVGKFSVDTKEYMYGYQIGSISGTPTLSLKHHMEVPDRTQGVAFTSTGDLILSRSYSRNISSTNYISQLRFYKPSWKNPRSDGLIYKNDAVTTLTLPPMSEGVIAKGSYLYVAFESSATTYNNCAYITDRVIAFRLSDFL